MRRRPPIRAQAFDEEVENILKRQIAPRQFRNPCAGLGHQPGGVGAATQNVPAIDPGHAIEHPGRRNGAIPLDGSESVFIDGSGPLRNGANYPHLPSTHMALACKSASRCTRLAI